MAYHFESGVAGTQLMTENSTTQKHPLGTIMRATDPTIGSGEFIYLQGIGSTILGSIVEYTETFVTALASIALSKPVALGVAMAATVADEFGWYQISGVAEWGKASALSHAKDLAIGATTGLAVAATTGLIVTGAITTRIGTATAPLCRITMQRCTGPSHPDIT